MIFQNIADYLRTLLPDETVSDAFINVNTENIPDVYLSVINGNMESEETWKSYLYEDNISDDEDDEALDDEAAIDDVPDDEVEEISKRERHPVLDVVSRERQAVILGNPGSGKTTLLKYLECRMAKNCLSGDRYSDIPLYLPLKELRKDRTLIDILMDYLQMPLFAPLFQQGRLFFLLDGLNEVQPDVIPSTIAAINWLIEKNHDCGILVTSRLYGYAARFKLPSYCLEGLTKENIRNYILRKTNSYELYERLSGKVRQRDVLKNPLLMSMVVSIWNVSHKLPASRIELYEGFIGYQLDKAGIDSVADRKELLDVLSHLAYDMRRFGFISDSCEGMESVLSCIVEEDRVGEMTRLLLRSGLLAVTRSNNGFWCISFIHETFQEYFAALYIHEEYRNTGRIIADLSASEWTETFKLLTEHIFLVSSPDRIIEFLSVVSAYYSRTSETPYFNDRIGSFADIVSGTLDSCPVAHSWMAQYVLFNMSNFFCLAECEQTTERFASLLDAIVITCDKEINLLLFRSYQWLQFWLFTEEEMDANTYDKSRNENLNVILRSISKFSDKSDLYVILQSLLNEYWFLKCVWNRIGPLLFRLTHSFNKDENRILYFSTGDLSALLKTGDFELMEREIEGKTNLFIPHFKRKVLEYSGEVVRFIYEKLFPKLNTSNRDVLMSLPILSTMMMKVSGLDKLLLFSPAYTLYKIPILKACYAVPDEWLSPDYFDLIKFLRQGKSHCVVGLNPLVRDAEGKYYIELTGVPSELAYVEQACQRLKYASITTSIVRMQYCYFTVVEAGIGLDTTQCKCIDPVYPAIDESYPVVTDDTLLLLNKQKKKYKHSGGNTLFYCTVDGITYKLTSDKKKSQYVLCADQPLERSLTISDSIKGFKAYTLERYYLFRLKELTPAEWTSIDKFNCDQKAALGVLGWYVGKMEISTLSFGIVKNTGEDYAMIQMRDKNTKVRYTFRFYKLMPGDIVLLYKKNFFRIEDPNIINRYVLITGTVVMKNGHSVFVKAYDRERKRDYYCHDDSNSFSIGNKVRFFPLLAANEKYKPLAYDMKRL